MSDYDRDSLGTRMKEHYENRSKTYLTRKVPVIIRLDGKAFHTFCKRFEKPFDVCLNCMLASTMKHLCTKVQGTIFAERHSDEISLLVMDRSKDEGIGDTTDAYFDYSVQKICSVAAATATAEFIKQLLSPCDAGNNPAKAKFTLNDAFPVFDCRCFNIPDHEIANYFWWRMLDAKRNSISMLAQAHFSHKELMNKSSDEMQEMVFSKTGINWGKLSQVQKIGHICYKTEVPKVIEIGPKAGETVMRSHWKIDGAPSNRTDLGNMLNTIMILRGEKQQTVVEMVDAVENRKKEKAEYELSCKMDGVK